MTIDERYGLIGGLGAENKMCFGFSHNSTDQQLRRIRGPDVQRPGERPRLLHHWPGGGEDPRETSLTLELVHCPLLLN